MFLTGEDKNPAMPEVVARVAADAMAADDDDDDDAEAAVEAHMLIAAAGAVDGDRADGRPAANGS